MMEGGELDLFARGIRQATETHSGAPLDAALAELGWVDALAHDQRAAVSVLFEHLGAHNVTSSALEQLIAATLGLDHGPDRTVVLPALRGWAAPGRLIDDHVEVRGLGSAELQDGGELLIVAESESTHVAIKVPTSLLSYQLVSGLDPTLGLCEITGQVHSTEGEQLGSVDWGQAVLVGQRAVSHELVGAARTMLALACTHALERVQFNRPIASFQAVRHRLADSLVAIEAANALLMATWDDHSPVLVTMAKALAGRSTGTVARNSQQVLAGIGFTAEHPFHRYVRRTMILDQLLGAGSILTKQLGLEVAQSGTLPSTLAL
jgi:Acyl-CoA dehydrogenase, C-terminal domain